MKVFFSLLALMMAIPLGVAEAGETWQGRPSVCDTQTGVRLERCQEWVRTVKRPDTRTSCCGEGDAYIADEFKTVNGELVAVITADYPDVFSQDEEGNVTVTKAPVHRGSEIVIPREKQNWLPEDANRSAHGVVYLGSTVPVAVYCWFAPTLY